MAFTLRLMKNRTASFSIVLEEAGGDGVTLAATDVARFKIWRRDGDTPTLDIDSAADTANGSGIVLTQLSSAAIVTLTVNQSDTSSLLVGPYSAEVAIVDDSDGDVIKHAESGVVLILPSGGGDVGLS